MQVVEVMAILRVNRPDQPAVTNQPVQLQCCHYQRARLPFVPPLVPVTCFEPNAPPPTCHHRRPVTSDHICGFLKRRTHLKKRCLPTSCAVVTKRKEQARQHILLWPHCFSSYRKITAFFFFTSLCHCLNR